MAGIDVAVTEHRQVCSAHLQPELRLCYQQPSLSHVGCKTNQNNIHWVTKCQTLPLTTWALLVIKWRLCAVCTYTAVITSPSHSSPDEHWWAWPLKDEVYHPLCLHLLWDVSTFLTRIGEGDGDLLYTSAGPALSLRQWWRCLGAKMLDYELWYRHTTFGAILSYNRVSRKYHEKHWTFTKLLLTVLELDCQSPYYWKRGIGRKTNHKPESFLITKHPSVVQKITIKSWINQRKHNNK